MKNYLRIFIYILSTIGFCLSCKETTALSSNRQDNKELMSNHELEMISAIEKDRKTYVLLSDVELFDSSGKIVAKLYKGAVIRDASAFDLESGDIGDNNILALMFEGSGSLAAQSKSALVDADDSGVYLSNDVQR